MGDSTLQLKIEFIAFAEQAESGGRFADGAPPDMWGPATLCKICFRRDALPRGSMARDLHKLSQFLWDSWPTPVIIGSQLSDPGGSIVDGTSQHIVWRETSTYACGRAVRDTLFNTPRIACVQGGRTLLGRLNVRGSEIARLSVPRGGVRSRAVDWNPARSATKRMSGRKSKPVWGGT